MAPSTAVWRSGVVHSDIADIHSQSSLKMNQSISKTLSPEGEFIPFCTSQISCDFVVVHTTKMPSDFDLAGLKIGF